MSVIFKIINLWLLDKDNASTITSKLNYQLSNYHIIMQHVLEVLNISRYYLATFLKHVYILESISESNKNERFSIDESHFLNKNNEAIWVIGVINNATKKFRLEFSKIRNEEILKKFIWLHIKPGNIIVSDGWSDYNFLSRNDSQYTHSIHNHGHGDLWVGLDSTSHIEQLWFQLKYIIKQIYYIITSEKYFLFIRQAQFQVNIKSLSEDEKLNEFIDTIKYIKNIEINNLFDDNNLISLGK